MEPRERFRLVAAATRVDGRLAGEEQLFLLRAARELGLRIEDTLGVLHQVTHEDPGPLEPPEDPGERRKVFELLVDAVSVDGTVDPTEQALLERVAPAFGMEEALGPMLRADRVQDRVAPPPPRPDPERWLLRMALALRVDGRLRIPDRVVLGTWAARLSLDGRTLRRVLNQASSARTKLEVLRGSELLSAQLFYYDVVQATACGRGITPRAWELLLRAAPAFELEAAHEVLDRERSGLDTTPLPLGVLLLLAPANLLLLVLAAFTTLAPALRAVLVGLCILSGEQAPGSELGVEARPARTVTTWEDLRARGEVVATLLVVAMALGGLVFAILR